MLKKMLAAFVILVGGTTAAHAVPITGLFNTGVDGSGNALAAGAADPHYSILSPSQPAIVIRDSIPGTWLPNTATRRWVWETVNGTPTNVTRTFRTTFNLTGVNPTTASISGQWATDNSGLDIFINGSSTGNTCGGFSSLCSFSVASGFVTGVNTLDFQVQDVGSISGFLVSSISGSADAVSPGGQIPEPASLALFGMGLAGLGAIARRKRA